MTRKEYLAVLKSLQLTPASQETAEYLGLTVRQIQNLAAGKSKVSKTLVMLLAMYLTHGRPDLRRHASPPLARE
jgi:plasmid maintenance system antidote protein VapI